MRDQHERSDEQLMSCVQQGDRAAYEELYARWKDRVFAFLIRRTGARQQAEEAHQEAWLRVYRWRHRFDTTRTFRPWLYTLAANAGRDSARPDLEVFELPAVAGEPPEVKDLVVRALHALKPTDRRILLLTAEGFTAVEIGEMLDRKPPAVRARISRARQRIREKLDE